MAIAFVPIPTEVVRAYQVGGPDAYGLTPERAVSDGDGVPCRHCFQYVRKGADYLVLAYRPFPAVQPYAKTGPIFLCAEACEAAEPGAELPAILSSPHYILRGYAANDRIVYGTGRVVALGDLVAAAETLLAQDRIAYAHVRSAANNCFHLRVERA